MQFHKEELDNLINNNLNNIRFHKIASIIMHVKNMCFNLWNVCSELST